MRRSPLAALVGAAASSVLLVPALAPAPTQAAPARPAAAPTAARAATSDIDRSVALTRWDTAAQLRSGTRAGLRVRKGSLVLAGPTATRRHQGTTYDVGTWTSPLTPAAQASELVASWAATTPGDSWVEVRLRAADATRTGRWLVMGRWAAGETHLRRTSVEGQSDALGRVATDTWRASAAGGATAYQLQVRVMRRSGTTAAPRVDQVAAVASRLPAGAPAVSAPGVASAAGTVLAVPAYSQMVHRGELPQYGGGGEAWCSPTSLSMVLGYYGRLPRTTATGPDPWVAEAARRTYDRAYGGTGNWPFNTAYAATRGLDAVVTRLRSLREAEELVVAGVPVVVSVSFASGGLTGAPISSTAGHLLVVVGFTPSGDVVVNDPAASSNAGVRRTYDRAQLERAWLGGSGGTAYVVHDDAHPLPAGSGAW